MKNLVFVLFLLPMSSVRAEDLALESYLDLVKREDIEVRRFIHQRVQTRFNTELNLPDSGWVFSLTNTYGIPQTEDAQRTSQLRATVAKSFIDTGTDVVLNYNTNDLADRNESIQSAEIQQSLIRNAFGQRTRRLEEMLGEQNKVIRWQVVESYEDYMAEKISEYLDFKLAHENYETAKLLLKEVESLANEVRARKRRNIALQVDMDRATTELLQYKRDLLEAKLQMESARKNLVARFDKDVSRQLAFDPQASIPFTSEAPQFAKEKQKYWKDSRSVRIFESTDRAAELNVTIAKKELYPEGKFILGYSQDESNRFSTVVNRGETVVGFNLSYNLDSSVNQALLRQSRYQKNQVELGNRSNQSLIKTQMEDLQNQIKNHQQRVALLEEQAQVSERLVKGERARFGKGRVLLETLINTQNRFQQIRYDLTAQKILLAKTIVAWRQTLDNLVEENQVLPD